MASTTLIDENQQPKFSKQKNETNVNSIESEPLLNSTSTSYQSIRTVEENATTDHSIESSSAVEEIETSSSPSSSSPNHHTIIGSDEVDENDTNALFWRQFFSLPYWGLLIVVCLFKLRINFYISTVKEQLLGMITDHDGSEAVNAMVEIFNIALPVGGLVAVPFIVMLLGRTTTPIAFSILILHSSFFGVFRYG